MDNLPIQDIVVNDSEDKLHYICLIKLYLISSAKFVEIGGWLGYNIEKIYL